MEFIKTKIEGLYLIKPRILEDSRGKFVKTLHADTFKAQGLPCDFVESYYSTSQKNVLRGMHFQTPPKDHEKVVDVVVDIRKNSPTYGEHISQVLSQENGYIFYIPKGCAHGFLALEDDATVHYMQTSMYAPNNDGGINPQSLGFDWGTTEVIVSDRDLTFPDLADFQTPFVG